MDLLPHLERAETSPVTASVIWLHGLGASGNDFYPVVPELQLPQDLGVRFIFPHAPKLPVTVNNGFLMPAWYDILAMDINRTVDEKQLRISATEIDKFIESEHAKGIPYERIVIIGFSQGGAVAYEVALRHAHRLGGLLALSTYFATESSIEFNAANKQLPIEIHHGALDPIVPEQLGLQGRDVLSAKNYPVEYRSYPMEHSVCPEQITHISRFIQTCLGPA